MALDKQIANMVLTAFEAVQEIKGENVIGIDLSEAQAYTDFVLVVSASNTRQAAALSDRVIEKISKDLKISPLGVEGYDQCEWILIDFGDIVVHVFLDEIRQKYRLEDMWMQLNPLTEEDFEKKVLSLVDTSEKKESTEKSV